MKPVLKIFVTAAILLSSQFSAAQDVVDETALQAYSVRDVAERYPAGSIQSQEVAAQALAAVIEARTTIEARFAAEQRGCYQKFFTTSCLDKATERRRVDLLVVKPIEVEANSYVRHARVAERDRRVAEKMQQSEERLLQSESGAKNVGATQSDTQKSQAQRKARADAYHQRITEHEKEQQRLKENELAEEKKRAENIRKYEEKLRASEARQQEILKNKAEKEASGKN